MLDSRGKAVYIEIATQQNTLLSARLLEKRMGYMRSVKPGSTADKVRQFEAKYAEQEKKRQEDRKLRQVETRRFWIQTVLTAVAALSGLAGLILQLCQ